MIPNITCDGDYLNFDGSSIKIDEITCVFYANGVTTIKDTNRGEYYCYGRRDQEIMNLIGNIDEDSDLESFNQELYEEVVGSEYSESWKCDNNCDECKKWNKCPNLY